MIKKSRKILTLLLAVLLIMSSMGALSVSAATTFSVDGEDKVVSNAEGGSLTATYTISNVPETGWYELVVTNVGADTNTDTKKYYKISAEITGNDAYTTVGEINAEETSPIIGKFNLTEGQTPTVTLTYDFSNETSASTSETIKLLSFSKVDPVINLSPVSETKIHALNDYFNRSFQKNLNGEEPNAEITSGDETGWTGRVRLGKNNYGIYRVDIPYTAEYDIYVLLGGTANAELGLYIDDMSTRLKYFQAGNSGNVTKGKWFLAKTHQLSAGTHDIKIQGLGSTTAYFYGLKLVPQVTTKTTLSTSATTEIIAKSTFARTVAASSHVVATSPTIYGVYAGNEAKGFVQTAVGNEFLYCVESPVAQKYSLDVILSLPGRTQNYKITNAETGAELCNGSVTTPSGEGIKNYYTSRQRVGEISLPQGTTLLKIEATSGSTLQMHALELTPYIENKIIADINTEINQGEGFETVEVPVNFEGKIGNLAAFQIYVAYDEGVTFTGYTAGNVVTGITNPSAKDNKVPLIWVDTSGDGVEANAGTLATLEFSVPKTTVKEYNFVVTVQEIAGTDEFNFADTIITENGKVTVKSTAPIITFTNGSEAVEDVAAGTMVLNVDLNGNNKNLVIFAIYSENGEYAVMEYSQTATIEDGIATATINSITLDNSKNYYAKAFVWDTTSYYGFVETLDN